MFEIGNYIIYKRDVCILKDNSNDKYYELVSISDPTLTIKVLKTKRTSLRPLITKEEALSLLDKVEEIPIIEGSEKDLELEYKRLMATSSLEDLIIIIKTTYKRNRKRLDNNKRVGSIDNHFYEKAEMFLCNELSLVLEKPYEQIRELLFLKINSN